MRGGLTPDEDAELTQLLREGCGEVNPLMREKIAAYFVLFWLVALLVVIISTICYFAWR